jgi:hypothetical protein
MHDLHAIRNRISFPPKPVRSSPTEIRLDSQRIWGSPKNRLYIAAWTDPIPFGRAIQRWVQALHVSAVVTLVIEEHVQSACSLMADLASLIHIPLSQSRILP